MPRVPTCTCRVPRGISGGRQRPHPSGHRRAAAGGWAGRAGAGLGECGGEVVVWPSKLAPCMAELAINRPGILSSFDPVCILLAVCPTCCRGIGRTLEPCSPGSGGCCRRRPRRRHWSRATDSLAHRADSPCGPPALHRPPQHPAIAPAPLSNYIGPCIDHPPALPPGSCREGVKADPLAELAFSPKLTKAQRASVHGCARVVGGLLLVCAGSLEASTPPAVHPTFNEPVVSSQPAPGCNTSCPAVKTDGPHWPSLIHLFSALPACAQHCHCGGARRAGHRQPRAGRQAPGGGADSGAGPACEST